MVRPLRAGIVVGIAVAVLVGALFVIRPVSDRVVALFGGPTGLERTGGARIWYRPPAIGSLERTGAAIRRCHDGEPAPCAAGVLVLEYTGMDQDATAELADVLVGGGLSMHEVLETSFFGEVARVAPSVDLAVDQWRTDEGERHDVAFLRAPTRKDLEDALARAAAAGVKPPPGSEVILEELPIDTRAAAKAEAAFYAGKVTAREANLAGRSWRTYLLASETLLDGLDVRSARSTFDPITNRPIVRVDLTGGACEEGPRLHMPRSAGFVIRDDLFEHSTGLLPRECARTTETTNGAAKFCTATSRISGRKLAIVFGGRLRSAPIINGPICGGELSITMGGEHPEDAEREADMLASVLERGAVPPGGQIEASRWVPRGDAHLQEWLGRALIGLIIGLVCGLACWLVVRVARPSAEPAAPRPSGEFPFARLFVTLAGPSALLIGQSFILPNINDVELGHVANMSGAHGSVIGLGLMPIVLAFVLVELVALAVPRLRWRRHDPKGRIRLRQATAVVALVCALVKGYFIARYFETAAVYGAEIVGRPGRGFELLTMLTLAAGTMLLALLAGIISVHGLANGYAVLMVSGWFLDNARPLIEEAHVFGAYFDRTRVFGLATLAVMMLLAWFALRWRVRGTDRELELRVPTSSLSPVADATSIPAVVAVLATLGITGATWLNAIRGSLLLSGAIVIGFSVWWSWVFARPTLLERAAMQAGFAPPSRAAWWRATLVSSGLLVALALLGLMALGADYWNNYERNLPYTSVHLHASGIADPAMALLATAVLLDMVAAARAHRERLVPVAELHQIQRAPIVERVLGAENIRFYIHAANVRTLFAFLGPWAPAVVMVPAASAHAAYEKLGGVLSEPRAKLPAARVEPARSA